LITDINSEDQLVQQTFADLLEKVLGWESAYAYDTETFGPAGTPGRASEREAVRVVRGDLRVALAHYSSAVRVVWHVFSFPDIGTPEFD